MLERVVAAVCRELFGRFISSATEPSTGGVCRSPIEPLERRVLLASIPLTTGSGSTTTDDLAHIQVTGVPDWRPQGPGPITGGQTLDLSGNRVSGAIESILVIPSGTAAGHWYVGTVGGGIWRSQNEGASWEPLTDQLPGTSISALAVDPTTLTSPDGPTLWAGTGTVSSSAFAGSKIGLLKSEDGGQNWQVINRGFHGQTIRAVVPTNETQGDGHVVVVATTKGIYRSITGGVDGRFQRVTGPGLPADTSYHVTDLKVDPSNSSWLYAAVAGWGVFFSNDAGDTWSDVTTNLNGVFESVAIELAISRATEGGQHPVYAALIARPEAEITAQNANVLTVSDATIFEPGDKLPLGTGGTTESIEVLSVNRAAHTLTLQQTPAHQHLGETIKLETTERLAGLYRSILLPSPAPEWTSLNLPFSSDIYKATPVSFGLHPGGQGDKHFSIAADPDDPHIVYVGGDRQPVITLDSNADGDFSDPDDYQNEAGLKSWYGRLFRGDASTITGTQWEQIVGFGASGTAPHADSRHITFVGDDLLEVNDGGIVRLSQRALPTRTWNSANGNLTLTELYGIGWYGPGQQIMGGAQDVGVLLQTGDDSSAWTTLSGGDGTAVAAKDGLLVYSTQNFGTVGVFDGSWKKPELRVSGATAPDGALLELEKFDLDIPFHGPLVINAVDQRILLGTHYLYESVGGVQGSGADAHYLLSTVGFKPVKNKPAPAGSLGVVTALIYGWKAPEDSGHADQPNLIYAGSKGNSGHKLWVRRDASVDPAEQFLPVLGYKGAQVISLAVDPDDWRKLYVLDANGVIWFTLNGESDPLHDWLFERVSDGLKQLPGSSNLRTIELVRSDGHDVLLAGGQGGVYRKVDDRAWTEFGGGLPNALVTDIVHDADSDLLMVSTLGRGAWRVDQASQSLADDATLTITGTAASDIFRLQRTSGNPWRLDLYHSVDATPSASSFWIDLAPLERISMDGGGGDDNVFVDFANGPISAREAVEVVGGTGFDQLFVVNGAAGHQTLNLPAAKHTLSALDPYGVKGTQTVTWSGIELAPDPAVLDDPLNILRMGLTGGADLFQAGLSEAAAGATVAAFDSSSLAHMVNGAIIAVLRPEDDPFVNASQVSPSSLAQLDGGTSVVRRLIEDGLNAFSLGDIGLDGLISDPQALEAALEALDGAANDNVTLDDTTDRDGDGLADILFDVTIVKALDGIVDLDIAADVLGGLGDVRLTGAMAVSADVHLHLMFGVDGTGFFILPSLPGEPTLQITNISIDGEISGAGRLGFLGVEVRDASLAFDPAAAFAVSLLDPVAGDGGIRLPELSLENLADLFAIEVEGAPGNDVRDVSFNATYALTTVVPGTNLSFELAAAEVPIAWDDLSLPGLADLLPDTLEAQALLEFIELNPGDVLGHLGQVRNALTDFMSSEDMDLPLPFAGDDSKLSELLDLAQAFQDKVLGALETAPGSGIPTFDTLQELASRLAGSLGLDIDAHPIVNYDPIVADDPETGKLWFTVPMHVAFDPRAQQLVLASDNGPGTSVEAEVDLSAALTFNFSFGYDLDAPNPAGTFFFRVNELSGKLSAAVSGTQAFGGSLGLFEASVTNGSLVLGADVVISMSGADMALGDLAGAFDAARTTVDLSVLLAAAGVDSFIGAGDVGLQLTDSDLAFGFFSSHDSDLAQQAPATFALDAHGNAALVGLDQFVELTGTAEVRWNSDLLVARSYADIGGTGVSLDVAAGETSAAVLGSVSIGDFAHLSGRLGIDLDGQPFTATDLNGATVDVSPLRIGGSGLFGFAGTGGPYWRDSDGDGDIDASDTPDASGAAGLTLSDMSFALALFEPTSAADARRFHALRAHADSIALVGFEADGVALSADDLTLEMNRTSGTASAAALNLSLNPQTAPGSSQTLDFDEELFAVSTSVELRAGPVTIESDLIAGLVNDAPVWRMPSLSVDVEGLVTVSAEAVIVHLEPASANQPLLEVASATAVLPDVLGGELTFNAAGLSLSRAGTFSFASASASSDDLLNRIGVGDFLPLKIQSIGASGLDGQPATFDQFRLTITGQFEDSLFQGHLADPVIEFGGLSVAAGVDFGFGLQIGSGSGVTAPAGALVLLREEQAGQPVPLEGPMRLGLRNLDFGAFAVDAVLSFGEFENGVYDLFASFGFEGAVHGAAGASGVDFDEGESDDPDQIDPTDPTGLEKIGFAGTVVVTEHADGGTSLAVNNASITTSFDTGPSDLVQLRVEELQATFEFEWVLDEQLEFVSSSIDFVNAAAEAISVRFGGSESEPGQEVMRFEATDATFHFRDQSQPWITFGSMSASFPKLQELLIGTDPDTNETGALTGTVSNFAIGRNFEFIPLASAEEDQRFGVTFDKIPGPEAIGLGDLDWLPIRVTKLGLEIGEATFAGEDLDIVLIASVRVESPDDLPIEFDASVSDLRVNLGTLADLFDPNVAPELQDLLGAVDIGGFEVGIEKINIADVLEIGGRLGLRTITDPGADASSTSDDRKVLAGTVGGYFSVAGIGGGIEITLTEVGPIMGLLDVPLAIPLGATGLIFSGVSGGFRFGGDELGGGPEAEERNELRQRLDLPDDLDAAGAAARDIARALLLSGSTFEPLHVGADDVDAEILRMLAIRRTDPTFFTWDLPVTLALSGEITTLASPGILKGELDAAIQIDASGLAAGELPGVRLLGSGEVTAFGLPLGAVGALLDLTDLLNPTVVLAGGFPPPGSPLKFLSPARNELGLVIDTEGMIEAPLIGLRTFIEGAVDAGSGALYQIIERVARTVVEDPNRPLARILGEVGQPSTTEGDAHVTWFLNRIRFFLPESADELMAMAPQAVGDTAQLAQALMADLFLLSGELFETITDAASDRTIFDEFHAALADEAKQAIQEGWNRLDPSAAGFNEMQPTILGIPFGETTGGSFAISKDGFSISFAGSLMRAIQETVQGILFPIFQDLPVGSTIVKMMQLGIEDRFDFGFALDGIEGLMDSILYGQGFPEIDPAVDFSASLNGTLKWLGFELAQVSGVILTPDSTLLDDPTRWVKVWELDGWAEPQPGVIPVERLEDWEKLETHGGIMLTGQLFAPGLLTDPIGLIASGLEDETFGEWGVFTPPDVAEELAQVFNFGDYIGRVVDHLLLKDEMARMQLYLPSFATLFELGENDEGGYEIDPLEDLADEAAVLADATFFRGFVTGSLLSMPMFGASVEVTTQGLEVAASIPALGDLDLLLKVGQNDTSVNRLVEELLRSLGAGEFDFVNDETLVPIRDEEGNIIGHIPELILPVPHAAASVSVSSERMNQMLQETFGLPAAAFQALPDLLAILNLYSPMYGFIAGLTDVSGAQRFGGFEFDAQLRVPQLLNSATFHFEAPLFVDGPAPSFRAEAHVDRLRIPSVGYVAQDILDASLDLTLVSEGGVAELDLEGTIDILGLIHANASGDLHLSAAGLYGRLDLTSSASGPEFDFPALDLGSVDFDDNFSLLVNTTGGDRTLPDGSSIDAAEKFTLKAGVAVSVFDTDDHDGISFEGDLSIRFRANELLIEGAANLVIDLPPFFTFNSSEHDDPLIYGKLKLTDRYIEGSFSAGELVNFKFDRFGQFTSFGVSTDVFFPHQAYVDDKRVTEASSTQRHYLYARLSKAADRDMIVEYELDPGSAGLDTDWTSPTGQVADGKITGSVTILKGARSSAGIKIDVLGDGTPEPDERFRFRILSVRYKDNDQAVAIAPNFGSSWITIVDTDDAAVELAHVEDGTLVLHVGPNTHLRDPSGFDGLDEVSVLGESAGVDFNGNGLVDGDVVLVEAFGLAQVYTGVSRIHADLGIGNDELLIDSSVTVSAEVVGGEGNDFIQAGSGDDTLDGGDGNDTLIGAAGDDALSGQAGIDSLSGDAGHDTLHGGDGGDTLVGGDGADFLYGEAGSDVILGDQGTAGRNRLLQLVIQTTDSAGAGNDHLEGGLDADHIHAGQGNDTLIGGAGAFLAQDGGDTMHGGAGDDLMLGDHGSVGSIGGVQSVFFFGSDGGNDVILGEDGSDTLHGQHGDDLLIGDNATVVNDLFTGLEITLIDSAGGAADSISGNQGADRIYGGEAGDTLTGGSGADALRGNAGDDQIIWAAGDGEDSAVIGGEGDDELSVTLGAGDDNLLVDRTAGQFRVSRLDGGSLVIEAVTATSGIERLTIDTGAGADDLAVKPLEGAGLASVDLHLGGSGPDSNADSVIIEGRSGTDAFLLSNPTTNTTRVEHDGVTHFTLHETTRAAGDRVNVDAGGGADILDASALGHNLLAVTLTGGADNDSLVGSAYNDHLDSGLGNDTVTGGAGTDTFADAGGSDTLIESRNADFTITDDTLVIGALSSFAKAGIPGAGGVVNSPLNNRGSTYAGSAEFEKINSIFESATLTGGAGNNTVIVGDDDGSITHGGTARSTLSAWTGTLTLDNQGSTGTDVEYYLINLASAAGARIGINDTGSGDYDELYVAGTSAADTFRVGSNGAAGGGKVIAGDPASASRGEVTHTGVAQLTVDALGGADTLNVQQTVIPTVLHGRSGADTIHVGSLAPAAGGNVNAIAAALYVNGNEDADTLNVDDSADAAANSGTLTGTHLTGLGMGAQGLTYATLEALNIDLGTGGDSFNVQGTHAGATTLETGNGNDTVNAGSAAPATGGTVNGIGGLLTIDSGAGTDTLNVDDTGDGAANTGRLTGTRLTGLGMGGNDAAKGIAYNAFETLNVSLGGGADDFFIDATHTGVTNVNAGGGADEIEIESIAGVTNVQGQGGGDLFTVNQNRPGNEDDSQANGLAAVLNLDGNDGGDQYVVWIWGNGSSIINAYDTGATGSDVLTMHGTSASDQFLIRGNSVSALAAKDVDGVFGSAERVNHDASMNGGLIVNGRVGDDYFASDDNAVETTLSGGLGDDRFQIGQMFEADRVDPFVAAGDEVDTTLTTVGYLTNGVSHEMTANGDDGEDSFIVFRNKAVLTLNGGAHNDDFTVRTFALAGSSHFDSEQTNVAGGGGDDLVDYAINALVNVNGGTGFDRLRVLGTEFGDHFIITEDGVLGAGLTISYEQVEAMEVHGGDGNDRFNVMSTSATVATYIFGGAGSDRTFVADAVANPAFAGHVRTLQNIKGPLIIDGAPGEPGVFNIPQAVMFPGESDLADGAGGHASDGSHSDVELAGDVDTIDIVHVDATTNGVGTLTDVRLSGLGMGGDLSQEINPGEFSVIPGGISYANAEIMEILLGPGHETLGVLSIAAMTTLIHGNSGNDVFNVSAAEVAGAMLVIYGDTAASLTHRGDPGDDRIDARLSSHGATYYGGAGNDSLYGGGGEDRIAGGSGNDSILGEAAADQIWGDSGFDVDRNTRITTVVTAGMPGQDDFGSAGHDTIGAGSGRDLVFGDHGDITLIGGIANVLAETGVVDNLQTVQRSLGGNDLITASGAGDNYLFGGAGSDNITGGDDQDLVLGDHGRVQFNLDSDPSDFDLVEVLDTHLGSGDSLTGGAGNDLILGQAGGDTISGGAGNDVTIGDNATVRRADGTLLEHDLRQRFGHVSGTLYNAGGTPNIDGLGTGDSFSDPLGVPHLAVTLLEHSTTTANDGRYGADSISGNDGNDVLFGQLGDDTIDGGLGEDYAEGNGGGDSMRGGLGQDMLIGGSSDRFGLDEKSQRPDGSDRIYGGDGTKTGRDASGDLTSNGHANDADFILGDNANAYVVLDLASGTFTSFNYDSYGSVKIKPRVVQLLDYTPGVAGGLDIGAGDVLHGEDGDDSVWGMGGGDAIVGGGNDDDLYGGNGHDWASGGAGEDGILGDDGLIRTSRNGTAEPLHGISAITALNEAIRTPGGMQSATIHLSGKLKKEADLEPFSLGGDDIAYGGLGNDSIHGGQGDDALSGAEALPELYNRAIAFADQPINPGNVLGYGQNKAGEFAGYDEYAPRTKIPGHLLNFIAAEADGDDAIFGDEGNDWAVGGTGKDRLYGGRGDDLLNVDDNLETNGGLNDQPDGGQWIGADLAYGGAGRDVLIANAEDDRLIDWVGESNSYIVPFAPFGARTISRTLQPQLPEFLMKLATSDGLDMSRIDPNAPERLGEPAGELGMVRQQDPDWREQTGAPDDPQPGNVGGGKRDVVATESFEGATAAARFGPDSGAWSVQNGGYLADYGGDTISVMFLDNELPAYFEVQATVRAEKARAGQKANGFIIFDYRGPTDFKYAGINDANDQAVIGRRTAAGWEVLKWSNLRMRDGDLQLLKVAINGTTATLLVNNMVQTSYAFDRRLDDGMVGLGVDNSRTRFDNVDVMVLPPVTRWQFTENFDSGGNGGFATVLGTISVSDGVLKADATGGQPAIAIRQVGAAANSFVELQANLSVSAGGFGGFVFDYYGNEDFKYAAYDAALNRLVIGHRTAKGWFIDATYSMGKTKLGRLGLTLQGTTASLSVNGVPVLGHVYNAALADGGFGTFARTGSALFDDVLARGDDPNVLL